MIAKWAGERLDLDLAVAALVRPLRWVEPGGRLVLSAYTNADDEPMPLFDDLARVGHPADGRIHIDRPEAKHPLLTAWIDV